MHLYISVHSCSDDPLKKLVKCRSHTGYIVPDWLVRLIVVLAVMFLLSMRVKAVLSLGHIAGGAPTLQYLMSFPFVAVFFQVTASKSLTLAVVLAGHLFSH